MPELAAHGLHVETPQGWEGRIFRRAQAGEINVEVAGAAAPAGEQTFPMVHVASVLLPMDMADYGSDVVEELGRDDALIVLKEFDPADVEQPLFERDGMPRRLRYHEFDPATLQRRLEPQAGYQVFFHEAGRAFCLYVVLGDYERREEVVPRVNRVLATIAIEALETTDEVPEIPDSTTTTSTEPTEPTEPTPPTPPEETTTTSTTLEPPTEPAPEPAP